MVSTDRHPFLVWIAGQKRLGSASVEGKDVILGDVAAKRFALGIHDGRPLFCWHPDDAAAMESIRWSSAAFAYGLRDRDWVALSAADARIKDSAALNPVPLRLFVPVTAGRLHAWQSVGASKLAVASMSIEKGAPVYPGAPFKELPLKLMGASELPKRS